jgi:hypothetical protein
MDTFDLLVLVSLSGGGMRFFSSPSDAYFQSK